jgi:tetratricopeptide (TPR) repeat protein
MEAAAPAIRAALKPRAIAYGYSMGGYGALKHGALLGVESAIAVAPQATIAPADVPWDSRFHRFHRPVAHARMRIAAPDLAPFSAVLADPHDATDWRHARLVAEAGPVHLLRAPLSGHAAIWLLASTTTLEAMLAAALAQDAAGMRAVLRARRAESPQWFRLMARAAFAHGHRPLAETLWARAEALGVPATVLRAQRAEAQADRVLRLLALRRPAAAAEAARALAARSGRSALGLGRAAHLLLAAGAAAEAEAAFRRALELRPEGADLHLGLSLALVAQDRPAEATAAAAQGHAAVPLDDDLAAHYGHMLNAAGPDRQAEAEAVFRTVLARDPRHGPALHGLGAVLEARGALAPALQMATAAAGRMPARTDVALWRAGLLLRSGDAPRAERLFRRLVRATPGQPGAHLGLAQALAALERRAEAQAVLRRAIALHPSDGGLAALLDRLRAPVPRQGLVARLRGLFGRAARR